jgi:hypothetical protein
MHANIKPQRLIFDIKQQSLESEPKTVRIVRRGEADNASVEFISKIKQLLRRFHRSGYVSPDQQ